MRDLPSLLLMANFSLDMEDTSDGSMSLKNARCSDMKSPNIIALISLSKTVFPGIRITYGFIPRFLRVEMVALRVFLKDSVKLVKCLV